jgi:hypothetical protein
MAKIILEYIKVLIWPVVILLVFLSFRTEISELARRTTGVDAGGVSVKFGATSTGGDVEAGNTGHPEMWFDLQNMDKSNSDCLRIAESALKQNGFENGGVNNGNTAYGYSNGYVGAIWCIDGTDNILFAVAGPSSKTASEKVAQLKDRFRLNP